jgi:ATP-dependent DNA helicase RecQ
VPSLRSGELVPSFASAVADRLGLPFVPVVSKVDERPPQREQQNTVYQQRNIVGAFAVTADSRSGPVLLLDDLSDSGWTLTEVGRLLRRAGSGPVYPVTLASAAGRD